MREWLERRRALLLTPLIFAGLVAVSGRKEADPSEEDAPVEIREFGADGAAGAIRRMAPVRREAREWKDVLGAQAYHVLREGGTDPPFQGEYHPAGAGAAFGCAGCGTVVFLGRDQFDSGTGWPSFTAPADARNIATRRDTRLFLERTEILCRRCGGHLGHVFPDGPPPSGLRYCINQSALRRTPAP